MTSAAAALGVAGVIIGVLVGATGIGGVLLVPFLVHGLGDPVQSAVAVALWSYLWSGLLTIAVALGVGIAVGTPLAHGVSQRTLRLLVAVAMLVAAAVMVGRLLRLF